MSTTSILVRFLGGAALAAGIVTGVGLAGAATASAEPFIGPPTLSEYLSSDPLTNGVNVPVLAGVQTKFPGMVGPVFDVPPGPPAPPGEPWPPPPPPPLWNPNDDEPPA